MKRADFSYELPPELIAQEPRKRGESRMMILRPAPHEPILEHTSFSSFAECLRPTDVLVLNDTRVIPARLYAQRSIELLLTREREPMVWEALCKPGRRVRVGNELRFSESLSANVLEKRDDGTIVVRFEGDPDEIERIGVPPLPPYIARPEPRDADRDAYQTVYAASRGAIAAPTAGLHFTPEILDAVAARGVEIVRITLHVGVGTFKPVKVNDIAEHRMDAERYQISADAAGQLNRAMDGRRSIVAVGTTTVRTLESAIRTGGGRFVAGGAETSMFITPGFEFRAVDRLLTNFHMPESTLLMLVSAFAGVDAIRYAYAEAIRHFYFFYSYGDCMFITNRG